MAESVRRAFWQNGHARMKHVSYQVYHRLRGNPATDRKGALRADIDEAAWSSLYRRGQTSRWMSLLQARIEVKVINHYGDEVLKVFSVR